MRPGDLTNHHQGQNTPRPTGAGSARGETKLACAKCPIHCYQPEVREKVKAVMRYAGPRMIWRHPILALRHWLDAYRKAPGGAGK